MSKTKQIQLDRNQQEMLIFYTRNKKVHEMEMQFWLTLIQGLQEEIIKQAGLKREEWAVDWRKVFETGKVYLTELPKPKVVEEKKGEEKP